MRKTSMIPVLGAISLFGLACASGPEKRFESITPGMTSQEVRDTMKEGPSSFEKIPTGNYMAWYWGTDHCVLFLNERVVSKQSKASGTSVAVAGGGYEESKKAQCLAPGQSAEAGDGRTINIPGVGTVKLPYFAPATPSG